MTDMKTKSNAKLKEIISDYVHGKFDVECESDDDDGYRVYLRYTGKDRCKFDTNLGIGLFDDYFSMALITQSDEDYTKRHKEEIKRIIKEHEYDTGDFTMSLNKKNIWICGSTERCEIRPAGEMDADRILDEIDKMYELYYPVFNKRVNEINKEVNECTIKKMNICWEM